MSIIRIVHKECVRKRRKGMSIIRIVHKECLQKKTKRYVYNKNSTQGMFTKEDEKVCL
jgi:hypothetical protein